MRTRTRITTIALSAALAMSGATGALASPPHGDGGHYHHVDTGNGGCVDVDAVAFNAEDRGLHRGAHESGPDQGVWHGSC